MLLLYNCIYALPLSLKSSLQQSAKTSIPLLNFSLKTMLNTAEKPGGPQSFEMEVSVGDGNLGFVPRASKALLRHDVEITKSESDNRLYRAVTLTNQLKVLLISDSQTDKAAACLAVGVGSFYDPVDVPGLAHFCEHMILLGSAKYPGENEYSKFITSHNGYCNAFTSTTETCYVFDIAPEYLYEALERFSEIFVAPLFTESATEREVRFERVCMFFMYLILDVSCAAFLIMGFFLTYNNRY